jgi:hypothetical protein
MFLIDLEQGRIIDDAEIKAELAAKAKPYREWLNRTQIHLLRTCRMSNVRPPDRTCPCSTASRPSATPRKTSSSC